MYHPGGKEWAVITLAATGESSTIVLMPLVAQTPDLVPKLQDCIKNSPQADANMVADPV